MAPPGSLLLQAIADEHRTTGFDLRQNKLAEAACFGVRFSGSGISHVPLDNSDDRLLNSATKSVQIGKQHASLWDSGFLEDNFQWHGGVSDKR